MLALREIAALRGEFPRMARTGAQVWNVNALFGRIARRVFGLLALLSLSHPMKFSFALGLLVLAVSSNLARAQLQLTSPFANPTHVENLDGYGAGASPGFAGFTPVGSPPAPVGPSMGMILPLNPAGVLMRVGAGAALFPQSGPNALFGRGTDVQMLFEEPCTKFGGFFSRTNIAVGVTTATFSFFLNGAPVGTPVTVTLPLPPPITDPPPQVLWTYIGFDLTGVGPGIFNEVRVTGNGIFQGYVGMDTLAVKAVGP
jgi:hypothetical protein